jgi:hypothetical protein
MDQKDRGKALEAIALMLAGYPSSQAAINEDTAAAYLRAVSHCSLTSIEAACVAFLRGQVTGHNNDFPPTAPRLASLAEALGEAARSLAEGTQLVRYRIGEQPPAGTVPLGGQTDDWRGRGSVKLLPRE